MDHAANRKLDAILTNQETIILWLQRLSRGETHLMNSIDALITQLNDETNAIGKKLDALQLKAGDAVTPEQVAALQAVSDRLKVLGADSANPIPVVASEPTATPASTDSTATTAP